jgi:hypothetical protein
LTCVSLIFTRDGKEIVTSCELLALAGNRAKEIIFTIQVSYESFNTIRTDAAQGARAMNLLVMIFLFIVVVTALVRYHASRKDFERINRAKFEISKSHDDNSDEINDGRTRQARIVYPSNGNEFLKNYSNFKIDYTNQNHLLAEVGSISDGLGNNQLQVIEDEVKSCLLSSVEGKELVSIDLYFKTNSAAYERVTNELYTLALNGILSALQISGYLILAYSTVEEKSEMSYSDQIVIYLKNIIKNIAVK